MNLWPVRSRSPQRTMSFAEVGQEHFVWFHPIAKKERKKVGAEKLSQVERWNCCPCWKLDLGTGNVYQVFLKGRKSESQKATLSSSLHDWWQLFAGELVVVVRIEPNKTVERFVKECFAIRIRHDGWQPSPREYWLCLPRKTLHGRSMFCACLLH